MSKIDQPYFFAHYPYKLNSKQKENIIFLINNFDESVLLTRLSWFANILGTLRRETNDTFAPVQEGYWIPASKRVSALYNYYTKNNPKMLSQFFPNGKYGTNYLGEGFVQLSLLSNFINFNPLVQKKFPNYDIVKNPELAMIPEVAWLIMEEGMTRDTHTFRDINFTGHTVEQYLNDKILDWVNVRKVVNGLDCAHEIAKYSMAYYDALQFENEEKPVIENVSIPDEELAMAEAQNPITIEVDGEPYKANILVS
jgi:hypothetical protein